MKKAVLYAVLLMVSGTLFSQTKEETNAILQMAGTYKVEFDFVETYSKDTNYNLAKHYHAGAKEMVIVTENSKNKISLSHFLVVNDTMVIKHWRQDWIYENTEFLKYTGDNTWSKYSKSKDEVKGTWTQKVFQVDESPRYESYGTWVKQDGEMIWNSSTCYSPLPRRELSVREDYNVIQRRSRIVVGKDYWYIEQDNYKLNGDTVLCHEKGMERFEALNFDTEKITTYWNTYQKVWTIVINEWQNTVNENQNIQLKGRLIKSDYQSEVFALVNSLAAAQKTETEIRTEIKNLIQKSCILK
jgi:hypothetical protein